MAMKRLVDCGLFIFDCETSGLDPARDHILEVGIVLCDASGEAVKETYNVKVALPEGATVAPDAARVNGYTPEGWKTATEPGLVRRKLINMASEAIFVAHNAPFDWGFVERLIGGQRAWPGPYHKVDTAALAWPLLRAGELPNVKLESLCAYFGHTNTAAHTALADAQACRAVYLAMMKRYNVKGGQLALI